MAAHKTAAKDEVAVNRLLDFVPFYLGFDAYRQWAEETGTAPDSFFQSGVKLAKRYRRPLEQGILQHFGAMIARPEAALLKPAYLRSLKSGSAVEIAGHKADYLKVQFMWFSSRTTVANTLFAGRVRTAAQGCGRIASEDDPAARVAIAAGIPMVSGLQAPRKWLKAAAERMGVALSTAEEQMVQVDQTTALATQVRQKDALLAGADPNSQEAADIAADRASLLASMEESAGGDAGILQAAAAASMNPSPGYNSTTGAKLSLSPQQEAAMLAEGPIVVAAGAGSGKTRVLAGMVAHRINEMGYDASSICAVSFTRASSKELVRRARDYGAVIDGAAASGFGTIHFLSGVTILGKHGQSTKRPKYFGPNKRWAPTTLVAIAVKQVGMKGNGDKAPEPKNLFTDKPVQIPEATLNTEMPNFEGEADPRSEELREILSQGIKLFSTGWPSRFKGGDWGRWATQFLTDMVKKLDNGASPDDLSPGQKTQVNKLMRHIQKEYGVSMRVGAVGENADAEVSGQDWSKATRQSLTNHQYWEQPARQWFNLGMKWEGGDKSGKEGQQFSAAGVKRKIDLWKGMGASPEEVWYAAGAAEGKVEPYTPEAAAYAAYEWLKGRDGEPAFRNSGDMSDLIIDAARTLVRSKKARDALQSRFKVILVDEAQDLNRSQHILFGLLAGALDTDLQPTETMTADTFGFIGDDKQAIYEFRGADPEQFIDKSDLVSGGQDYKTHLLDTNYRSGQSIVEAANQLIKHNSKQIPMTCKANYEAKGDGAIKAETFNDQESAADMVAETIAEFADANATADAKYSNYGIAVRSNAEAMHYALGLVKKAIPFRSKVNPFKSPPIKSMLGWMAIVEGGPKMEPRAFKAALKDALRMPASFLGKAFTNRVEDQPDPVRWLGDLDPHQEFRGNYAKNVAALLDNLFACFGMHRSPEGPDKVYDSLLTSLKSSNGKSFFDGIVNNIKEDNNKMADLAAENPDGIPTDEQIEDAAEEELVLLSGLMDSKGSVDGVMEYVRELKAVNDKVAAGEDDDRDAVQIGTMHSWKGLEVPKLFLPLVRGKFPRVKLKKNDDGGLDCDPPDPKDPALAAERRLAYVAITRAEQSCVMMDIVNPSKAFEMCGPSQFIDEACVKWADADPDGAPEDDDPMSRLAALWAEDSNWPEGPTDAEAEEARMLHEMNNTSLDETAEAGDEMLAMWLKTTEEG